jgi:hypothetical protein
MFSLAFYTKQANQVKKRIISYCAWFLRLFGKKIWIMRKKGGSSNTLAAGGGICFENGIVWGGMVVNVGGWCEG